MPPVSFFVDWSRDPDDEEPEPGEADTVGQPAAQPEFDDEIHEVTG